MNWKEGGYIVSDGEEPRGEIVIGGGHVAKVSIFYLNMCQCLQEYYQLPEKTQEEFFNDSGIRWFKTVILWDGEIVKIVLDYLF